MKRQHYHKQTATLSTTKFSTANIISIDGSMIFTPLHLTALDSATRTYLALYNFQRNASKLLLILTQVMLPLSINLALNILLYSISPQFNCLQ